jgi:hypothetical protein
MAHLLEARGVLYGRIGFCLLRMGEALGQEQHRDGCKQAKHVEHKYLQHSSIHLTPPLSIRATSFCSIRYMQYKVQKVLLERAVVKHGLEAAYPRHNVYRNAFDTPR